MLNHYAELFPPITADDTKKEENKEEDALHVISHPIPKQATFPKVSAKDCVPVSLFKANGDVVYDLKGVTHGDAVVLFKNNQVDIWLGSSASPRARTQACLYACGVAAATSASIVHHLEGEGAFSLGVTIGEAIVTEPTNTTQPDQPRLFCLTVGEERIQADLSSLASEFTSTWCLVAIIPSTHSLMLWCGDEVGELIFVGSMLFLSFVFRQEVAC